MIHNIKLICTDMDGTLLNDKQELPIKFKKVMRALEDRGIIFVIASGRGIAGIKFKIDYDSDNLFYISDNGAILRSSDKMYFKNYFSNIESKRIINKFRNLKEATIIAAAEHINYVELHSDHSLNDIENFFVDFKVIKDLNVIEDDIVRITMLSHMHSFENYLHKDLDVFKENYFVVRGGEQWIDIMKQNSNKGNALEYLLSHLNISKENTIGFGDYHNDLHMLETVGIAYAVGNAHPDIKAMANEVIGTNNDDAVLNKIIELLDLKL